jgi:NADH dehydrogenase
MNNHLVTVFGASGFLGRHTVRALARRGYRIRAVTRRPNLAGHLPPMGHVGQIQLFKGDVLEPEQVSAALKGASFVVNLTGVLIPHGDNSFDALHAGAAQTIAEEAAKAGVTALIHVSAIGADLHSESAYARSKADGENRVRTAFPGATILRPSIVFGPEDSFFNRFAALARALPALPLIGGGHTKFQPVFVGNVADAVATALESETSRGKTYELGGPSIYSFRELMEFILRETDRKRALIPVPFALASVKAMFLQFLPGRLLTPDQVKLLKTDNVVGAGALTLTDLLLLPNSVEAEIPAYLWRFKPKGQYEAVAEGKA